MAPCNFPTTAASDNLIHSAFPLYIKHTSSLITKQAFTCLAAHSKLWAENSPLLLDAWCCCIKIITKAVLYAHSPFTQARLAYILVSKSRRAFFLLVCRLIHQYFRAVVYTFIIIISSRKQWTVLRYMLPFAWFRFCKPEEPNWCFPSMFRDYVTKDYSLHVSFLTRLHPRNA